MTERQAHTAVSVSALVVGGIYLYRKLVEPAAPSTRPAPGQLPTGQQVLAQLAGAHDLPPVGQFVTGWGFVFIILSILAEAEPDLAGVFAGTVAAGSLLTNGVTVATDVMGQLTRTGAAGGVDSSPTVQAQYLGSQGTQSGAGSDIPFLSPTPPGVTPQPRPRSIPVAVH